MADWTLTGISITPAPTGSEMTLNNIPVGNGYSWPANSYAQLSGTGFGVFPTPGTGANPVVTVGSATPAADGSNICGTNLNTSSSTTLDIVHIPPSPDGQPGPQTLYVKNFPGGTGAGSTLELTNAINYAPLPPSTTPFVPIVIENQSGKSDSEVWIQFLNGTFNSGQTGAGGTVALKGNTGYSLEQLTGDVPSISSVGSVPNVSLNAFENGRIYVNTGSTGLTVAGGDQPDPTDTSSPNYDIPFAYIEPFIDGSPSNNIDFTNIDIYSFAMEASYMVWDATTSAYQATGLQLFNSNPSGLLTDLEGIAPSGAVINNAGGTFVRVLGPGQVAGYHTWTDYMNFLGEATTTATTIGGRYAGDGTPANPAQYYNLSAAFDGTNVTLSGIVQAGEITAPSGTPNTTIVISYSDLNDATGVYGANPPYTVNNTPYSELQNDVYGWIVGDLLAGMNYGFAGSSTPVPGQTGKTMGELQSQDWFTVAAANPTVQFGGAQSNTDYYNQYAAANLQYTNAYGFPFSDRLGDVLLYFTPSTSGTTNPSYLQITILEIPTDSGSGSS